MPSPLPPTISSSCWRRVSSSDCDSGWRQPCQKYPSGRPPRSQILGWKLSVRPTAELQRHPRLVPDLLPLKARGVPRLPLPSRLPFFCPACRTGPAKLRGSGHRERDGWPRNLWRANSTARCQAPRAQSPLELYSSALPCFVASAVLGANLTPSRPETLWAERTNMPGRGNRRCPCKSRIPSSRQRWFGFAATCVSTTTRP